MTDADDRLEGALGEWIERHDRGDTSYGSGGVTAPLGDGLAVNAPMGVRVASDGRIVVGGNLFDGPGLFDWFLARYDAQ